MILAICILLLVSLIIGCSPAQRPDPRITPAPNQQQDIDRNRITDENNIPGTGLNEQRDDRMFTDNNRPIRNNNMDNRTVTDNKTTMDNRTAVDNMNDRVNRIIREIENIRDVRRAAVVITERTALVGIDLTSETKGKLNSQIKQEIEDAVKGRIGI